MNIRNTMSRAMAKSSFTLKKNSPHIMFGAGLIGVVASTVLACKATLKTNDMFAEMKDDVDAAKTMDDPKDVAYAYIRNTVRFGKAYAPAIAVGGVSVALLTGSHIQLSRRNAALTVAYTTLHQAYLDYRERVRAEVGEEKELELYRGISWEEAKDEKGKLANIKTVDPNKLSPYARIFDEGSPNWNKNAEYNRIFIQCQQNYANNLLHARGHLFLNEVYDALGLPRSHAGQFVGWAVNAGGDNYVDFGLFEAHSSGFVNGNEPSIILDFNVDGPIIDYI